MKGLKLKQLAGELGISVPYLSQLESGRAIPSEKLVRRIARWFGEGEERIQLLARRMRLDSLSAMQQPEVNCDHSRSRPSAAYLERRDVMVRLVANPQVMSELLPLPEAPKTAREASPPLRGGRRGDPLPDVFDAVRPSVVAFASKLVATRPGLQPVFPRILGTGFILDPNGIAVTNNHVVEALQALPPNPTTGARSDMAILWTPVQFTGEGHVQPTLFVDIKAYSTITSFTAATPFYGERLPDLAFVQLNVRDVPTLELETRDNVLRAGLAVATAGFPLGTDPLVIYGSVTQMTPFLRQGIISSLYPFPCPQPHGFTMDVMSQEGASGSPVFLTDAPKAVGIVHAGIPQTNVTIAIPAVLIRDALSACTNGKPLDIDGVPTLEALLQGEWSRDLRWDSFLTERERPS